MRKKTYHVNPSTQGQWVVRQSGTARAERAFEKQGDAIHFVRKEAKRASEKQEVEVYIHGRDGRIRQKDTYESDHAPPPKRKG